MINYGLGQHFLSRSSPSFAYKKKILVPGEKWRTRWGGGNSALTKQSAMALAYGGNSYGFGRLKNMPRQRTAFPLALWTPKQEVKK